MTSTSYEWQKRAACIGLTHKFFPPYEEDDGTLTFAERSERDALIAEAKAICDSCPVIKDCLAWALNTELQHGIAGGLTETARRRMLRRLKKQARNLRREQASV